MSKRIWRDLLVLIGIFALLWLGFTQLSIFPDKDDLTLSEEKEMLIGEEMLENLLLHQPGVDSIDNPKVNAFIDSIYMRLSNVMEPTKFNYTFIVVENEQVNAFAMPGGFIVFYTGLIDFCDSPEEIASVMAHEIGHVENRHLINRLIKKLGIAILLSGDATVISEVSQMAISTVFDRKQEREADEFAQDLLAKTGISPRIIATFFRKLEAEGLTYNKKMEILATHPHHDERIKAALSYALDSAFVARKLDLDLDAVKFELAGLN